MKNYLTLVKICKKFLTQEKIFHEDLMTKCECRLSEEIDLEYEAEMKAHWRLKRSWSQFEFNRTEHKLKSIRAVTSYYTTIKISTQTDEVKINKPKIPTNRNCTNETKSAYAKVSSACGISVEMARIAIKTTCKALYKQEFF